MATYSGMRIKHQQLTAATVDTVTLNADYPQVEVVNRDGAAAIFFTIDGDAPTVEGDNTHVLPAAISGVTVPSNADTGDPTVVRLISSGTPKYSVRGVG